MQNHASFIWAAADLLRGSFKSHEFGDVILPFTVLRRIDSVLAPTKEAVLKATAEYGTPPREGCCAIGPATSTRSGTPVAMI